MPRGRLWPSSSSRRPEERNQFRESISRNPASEPKTGFLRAFIEVNHASMPQFFTYSWKFQEASDYRSGEPIGVAYGSRFARRGIVPGDVVYIVSVQKGNVYLLGKMLVGLVTYSAEDYRRWVSTEPPSAAEYLVAEACTPAKLERLSEELARSLRFLRGKQHVGLVFRKEGGVDPQSLRSVRQLSPDSAIVLDRLLPALVRFRPASGRRR